MTENTQDIGLYTFENFYNRYFHYWQTEGNTQKEAYNLTENEFIAAYGQKRYSSFDSFRQVYSRKLAK